MNRCGGIRLGDDSSRPPRSTTGERIQHARVAAGIAMREVARRVGLTPPEISRVEWDPEEPEPQLVARILAEIAKGR